MKQSKLFFLSLLLCMGMAGTVKAQPETKEQARQTQEDELGLYAQSAVLMDAKTGRILYGKNEEAVRPMASTTKIMTCIIALEHGDLSDLVTASQNAASQPKVHLGVYKGEAFKLEDLLYSLMLESHNDTAVMIAEHVGGSTEGFASLMNQKARDLGCSHTYYITPNGLDASANENGQVKEHSTTAADLARIMNYCIETSPQKDLFLKITGTQSYYFTDSEGKRSYNCSNHNALLTMLNGVVSGKTGFTGGAGYSYVGALEDGERMFTIALLGCGWPPHKTYKWSDARKLFEYGKERYHYREVFKDEAFPEITVENGVPPSGNPEDLASVPVGLNLKEDEKSLRLLMSEEEEAAITEDIPDSLNAPLKKGQAVGMVEYRLNGEVVKAFPLYLTEDVEKITFPWCLNHVITLFQNLTE